MQKIKMGDQVVVLSGKDKGKTGKVLKLFKKKMTAQIEGVGEVKRATRPSQSNPTGGFTTKNKEFNLSKIALWSDSKKRGSKALITKNSENKNQRVLKLCNTVLK